MNGLPLQLDMDGDRWKVIVVCMLLNRASGGVIRERAIHTRLLLRWPDPERMAVADPVELADVLRPLGFQNRRSRLLREMSAAYDPETPVEDLPGCGRYAAEAVRVFCDGETDFEPEDVVLAEWVATVRSQS